MAIVGWLVLAQVVEPAAAQTAQQIAAVVNEDIITTQGLTDRLTLAVATSGLPNDENTRRQLAPQVLRTYIDETLQLQEAQRLNLSATEAEVDRALGTIAERNRIDLATLTGFLRQRGADPEGLRSQLRAQIAWVKIVNQELRPRVVVTREQVEIALRGGTTSAADAELQLAEILLPVYEPGQEAQTLEEAGELVAALRNGADFSALARQVSTAASAENGGDLGWVRASAILPDFREPLLSLDKGEIGEPIASPAGVHVFLLRDRRAVGAGAGEEDRAATRERLEREQLERAANRYLRDLRRDAYIDIRV